MKADEDDEDDEDDENDEDDNKTAQTIKRKATMARCCLRQVAPLLT